MGIAAGKVIVDRNQLAILSTQGIEIKGAGRDQGFSLSGCHFSNVTIVQSHTADQLNVIMHHFPFNRMIAYGNGFSA